MAARRLTTIARELQSASNRRALEDRNQNRDTIVAGIYAGEPKGVNAARRVAAREAALASCSAEVARLRAELGKALDEIDKQSR